ncbi:MAG: hypothetical protein KC419_20175, partial [Anaerolineales bacterium]|nr:hypothetical protein [Anaerolineales bacterium]
RPQQAAVALHEYSYVVNDIFDGFPYKIGRFKSLFDVCDKYGIARPTIHITEWGWTLNNVPSPGQAIADMKEVMQLYARYPEIKGAAIWYLGPSFGGIANKAQKLIKPVTDFTLSTVFEVTTDPPHVQPRPYPVEPPDPIDEKPIEPEPVEPDPVEPEPVEPPQPKLSFVADVTIPDDSRMPVGTTFTKTWRVRNTGNVAWSAGYKLVHMKGDAMKAQTVQTVPAAAPGTEADISLTLTAPQTPGVYFSDWQMRDPQGKLFGDVLFTRIIAEKTAVPLVSNNAYVADLTIPDDTVMKPGQKFVKTWRIKNTGTTTWGPTFTFEFVRGVAMTPQTSRPLPVVQSGATVDISLSLQAPTVKGTHFGDWKMKDARGKEFGEIIFLRIVVK